MQSKAIARPLPCATCDSSNCTCSRVAIVLRNTAIILAALIVVGVLVWQAIVAHGAPDPTAEGISRPAVVLNTSILVFREGLEAILVLAALTASLARTQKGYWKPVALGAGFSFLASVATWFIVVAIISSISAPALHVQAATGLLAIVVLLVIMNWFFHRVYWKGWIAVHNKRKRDLTETPGRTQQAVFRGLVLLGFTSIYREGFEIVLFLQTLRLRAGSEVVLAGVSIGLALTLIVAMLTFVVHRRLPYKKMLVLTGVMLGGVLLVMVGEQALEMQQAGWLSATHFNLAMPAWLNVWFGIYPTFESIGLQLLAAILVIGSYFIASRVQRRPRRATGNECVGADEGHPKSQMCADLACEDSCPIQ